MCRATGELTLDYGAGVMTIDAPCAQGVNGFLARAGRVATKDLTIQSSNEYGAIVVVSLDGKPLASSTSMLVQAMTEEQNFGYATTTTNVGAGVAANLITAIGYPPIVVREINGMVRFTRPDAATLAVTALDSNGYPVKRVGTADAIALEPATLYYLISKK
jgi:hypothetical protein